MNFYIKALRNLRPNAEFTLNDAIIEHWSDIDTQPTEEEIQTEINRLEEEYNNLEYSRLRTIEYSKLNQDEMRFDDQLNGTTLWFDTIRAIKEKYPKPL